MRTMCLLPAHLRPQTPQGSRTARYAKTPAAQKSQPSIAGFHRWRRAVRWELRAWDLRSYWIKTLSGSGAPPQVISSRFLAAMRHFRIKPVQTRALLGWRHGGIFLACACPCPRDGGKGYCRTLRSPLTIARRFPFGNNRESATILW